MQLNKNRLNMNIDSEQKTQVQHFTFLGSNIIEDGSSKTSIRCRIAQVKRTFEKKSTF